MIVAITGHRSEKIREPERIRAALGAAFERLHVTQVVTGMALGVDMLAAEVALACHIPFVAAVPCDDQDRLWPALERDRYEHLLVQAADTVVVTPGPYALEKMQARNCWMVDRAEAIVAIYDGTPGGTQNCIKYALMTRKPIYRVHPATPTEFERWGKW